MASSSSPEERDHAAELRGPATEVERLLHGDHHEPHALLGAHPCTIDGRAGLVVRAHHPEAARAQCLVGDEAIELVALGRGLFATFLPGRSLPFAYRLRFHFSDGNAWERGDPYRFLPSLGEVDLHLIGEGNHRKLWQALGANIRTIDGETGTAFSVWAPNARRVSIIADFNGWDGRLMPMRSLGSSGIWELFVPGVGEGALYKYEIKTQEGGLRFKADPMAECAELPPGTASVVTRSRHVWFDQKWMTERRTSDATRRPVAIYEVHLGSWMRVPEEGHRSLSYREIAPKLVQHCRRFGFTHVELMPVAEHPFFGSWGYQVTGYFAPSGRYGTPDDFRYFVDYFHQHGIGVIVDWVPAHFPKDDFALRRFDGTALYEHEDPRLGEHPDWGTLIFNFGRAEVRNFLMASALYWLDELHVDGLRVDAVASMLYLDYSRPHGEWLPNPYGGRENIDAIEFLKATNHIIREEQPGAFTVAEESTSWAGVTRDAREGGLGFTFKWNMGWMHDTLKYFEKDPIHRRYHQDQLTFSMIYEFHERFINSISHDEVVHGKGSLFSKMPGDKWQKLANLRLLLAYQYTRPGKQLVFMGTEVAQEREWNHETSVDWHLAGDPDRQKLQHFMETLGKLYLERRALWENDPSPASFEWIDCNDRDNSVLSYVRRSGDEHVVVVMNMTPVPRHDYRVGMPEAGSYVELLSTDDPAFGGSDVETRKAFETEPIGAHGRAQSVNLTLPPLGLLVYARG
ncbi:MAG: 1,4-alpha-glucan branching protein GlgB [Polyangiaceae bacterium]